MKFQIQNDSTLASNEDLLVYAAACDIQLSQLAAVWSIVASTVEFSADKSIDPNAYQCQIKDSLTDAPGALGYHDVDSQGKPILYIGVKECLSDKVSVSSCISHELCEANIDPACCLWTQTPDGNLRAYEACDACEADSYVIKVGDRDVEVSNFLTPNYFSPTPIAGIPFDYLKKLSGPAPARTPGGYDIVLDVSGQPSQEFSKTLSEMREGLKKRKLQRLSRTSRRLKGWKP